MKRVLLSAALLLAAACAAFAAVSDEVVSPYVEVRNKTANCRGSGTAIRVGGKTLILTAGHVVADPGDDNKHVKSVMVLKDSRRAKIEVEAKVVYYSPPEETGGTDLALLEPTEAAFAPAALGLDAELEVGEDSWYCGTAYGLHASLEKTIINKVDHQEMGHGWVLVNGHGTFGNSGCGIFVRRDKKYVLVGVLTRGATGSPKTPCMCEPPDRIEKFLADYLKSKEGK